MSSWLDDARLSCGGAMLFTCIVGSVGMNDNVQMGAAICGWILAMIWLRAKPESG